MDKFILSMIFGAITGSLLSGTMGYLVLKRVNNEDKIKRLRSYFHMQFQSLFFFKSRFEEDYTMEVFYKDLITYGELNKSLMEAIIKNKEISVQDLETTYNQLQNYSAKVYDEV